MLISDPKDYLWLPKHTNRPRLICYVQQGLVRLVKVNRVRFLSFGEVDMSSEWIKVTKELPDKREMILLESRLGWTRAQVFYEWFRLYAWADSETANGYLAGMTVKLLATAADVNEEFLVALGAEDIAWLVPILPSEKREGIQAGSTGGLLIRHWQTHNGQCAKARSSKAKRQGKYRENNPNK